MYLSDVALLVTVQCVKLIGFSTLSRAVFIIPTEQILCFKEFPPVFSEIVII